MTSASSNEPIHPVEPKPPSFRAPELLAPAGDFDCIRAAVENGADAVYFGLRNGFNARARAANFELSELADVMHYLQQRNVHGYVTLNTLAFSDELEELEKTIRQIAEAGVSAVLVQDLGVVRLIRSICPTLSIHASTQMTLTSAEGIRVAESLGVERVVLARELSLREIKKIRERTAMPLEIFVHGALCVAYSGQCLTSESLGGRSANRGQCAQACRMSYDLVCDGQDVDLGAMKYLLSPQDLAAYDLIPEMVQLGICALKIEGRLKTPEYVANITRHYRQAIDAAVAGEQHTFTRDAVREMELSFSRGFSPGWLRGCDHKMLVPGLSSAKRGVLLGEIHAVHGQQVTIQLSSPVAAGDGIVFEGNRLENDEMGGRIFEVKRNGRSLKVPVADGLVDLTFRYGAIAVDRLVIGQRVWKTDDPQLTARLRSTFTSPDPIRRCGLDLVVEAGVGRPLRITGRPESGATCEVVGEQPLEKAEKHPLTEEVLTKQLGRLGGTVYELSSIDARIDGTPMVPLSMLGKLRHEIVRQLDASALGRQPRSLAPLPILPQLRAELPASNHSHLADPPQLRVLCRSLEQLETLLELGVQSIYVDFQDIRQYGQAVRRGRAAAAEVFIATPRIQKPDERGIFLALLKHQASGILVRNLGGLAFFSERNTPYVADFSLNATNELTVAYLCGCGAQRITASYDMNRDQLLHLIDQVPADWLEVVVHQHMPLFHMEHCVFCAVLSPGTNKTNCGRPCDRHQVELRDHIGMQHSLQADVGCRNTLFNAVPQSGAEAVSQLIARGVRSFRIELLTDRDSEIRRTVQLYRGLLAGQIAGHEVWTQLRAMNRVGVTRGTLEERRNPLAIV